jgi:hypothetical protein
VLDRAVRAYAADPGTRAWLRGQLDRLDEPLRVAVAGKVKAGKSTLLNALVGEQIAPTDAAECTRVVTWYRDARAPAIVLHPRQGTPHPVPVDRRGGGLVVDLAGIPAAGLDRIVVDWPSQHLRAMTLIDTPGIASLSRGVSSRSLRFLAPDDDRPTEADAVIYLMRHLHVADTEFLEAFRDRGVARAASVNTVAVISRADEIGGGRVDAMSSARAVARRYRVEPALRGLCQDTVAVAGLLAQTARTLRQQEFVTLCELARMPRADLDAALLTTDRFLADDPSVPSTAAARDELLTRFGVFGLRLATALIRQNCASAAELAAELLRRSGLPDLQHLLATRFGARRDLLKARSALMALDAVLRDVPCPQAPALAADVERILTDAHEFVELRLLSGLRCGDVRLPEALAGEAERLLGDLGADPVARLGLATDAGPDEVRAAAIDALHRWQEHAENPLLGRAAADACRSVVRTCEGLLTTAPVRARR